MISKRTGCGQIELTDIGLIFVKLTKQIVEDGRVIASEPHRFPVEPGESIDAAIAAQNAALGAQLGYPEVDSRDLPRLRRAVEMEHTPEVVEAFATFRAARAAYEAKDVEARHAIATKDERAAERLVAEMPGVKKAAEDAHEALKAAVRGNPEAAVRKVG